MKSINDGCLILLGLERFMLKINSNNFFKKIIGEFIALLIREDNKDDEEINQILDYKISKF